MKNELGFDDAIAIAKGCFDYGGGYRSDEGKLEIFHHGIQTVVNALTAARKSGLADSQVAVLHCIGLSQSQDPVAEHNARLDAYDKGRADEENDAEFRASRQG